MIFIYILYILY